MNREEWQYSSSLFRQLLKKLEEGNFQRRVKYRFGLQFNPMFGFYHLWDGLGRDEEHKEPLTLATIKLRPKIVTIRHLPSFMFKEELLKFSLPDRKSIFLPSDNVVRHDGWVHNRIQSSVERRVRDRRDFLERQNRETPPNSILVEIVLSPMEQLQYGGLSTQISPTQQVSTVLIRLTVVFGSQQELERHQHEAHEMIRRIHQQYGVRLDSNRVWEFAEIVNIFHEEQRRYDGRRAAERQFLQQRQSRESAYYNMNAQTFYGRDVGQLQQVLQGSGTVSAGQALTEQDMMRAVEMLDRQNVPQESNIRRRDHDVPF